MKDGRQGILPLVFELHRRDDVTARAGLSLVLEAAHALGLPEAVAEKLQLRERRSGYSEAEKIEAIMLLLSAGGECVEDIRLLSADEGLERMLARSFPSPDTLHSFLALFHDEACLAGRPAEGAFIPGESDALRALAAVNTQLVQQAGAGATEATIDLDATIIESHKEGCYAHYKGGRGYQPALALWAEENLVVADEFRDGNVPAGMDPLALAQRAFTALPAAVRSRFFRADSACYEEHLLKWLCAQKIAFTISADMTEPLRARCIAATDWELLEERPHESVHSAEIEFAPGNWPKTAEPLRYVALRFSSKQRALFGEENVPTKYLAVVSNRHDLPMKELLRWHWAKAGTIEHAHDIMKNELGAGSLPSGLFGANAAWYRLSGITYNVLSYLRRHALPSRLRKARPKRLRFEIFTMPARLVEPRGVLTVRSNAPAELIEELVATRTKLLAAYEQRRRPPPN